MKTLKIFSLALLILLSMTNLSQAQGPRGRDLGFGLILGDPTGLTLKYWNQRDQALEFSLGNSYFGSLRLTGDYLWHFNAFNSQVVSLYAGPGVVLGFGSSGGWFYNNHGNYFYVRSDNKPGFGVRGLFGLNIIPRRTPLEIFGELGVLVGIIPGFGSNLDAAIGVRFYP